MPACSLHANCTDLLQDKQSDVEGNWGNFYAQFMSGFHFSDVGFESDRQR